MKFFLYATLFFFSYTAPAQTIGTFNSVQPTAQTQSLVLPATHTFQRLLRSGAVLTSGQTAGDQFDFCGYVPIGGSSTTGYLSVSSETAPAGVAILSIALNSTTKLWTVNSSGNVPFPLANLGYVVAFCAGTVTPTNHIMVCEETASLGDYNGDGYNDDGWIIEIDPATQTVINQDGIGGVDKLWAMGRQKHEDIAIKPDGSAAYWSADNATDGYVYKFVPTIPNNFSSGTLYVLKTTPALGTGTWEVVPNTTVADRNNTITLSQAAGAYNFVRIEGLEIGPDGKIYFPSTTSGTIYRFRDLGTTVDGIEPFLIPANFDVDGAGPFAPEPWGVGADNLAFDSEGNLWVLQDGDKNYIWVVGANHTAAAPNVRLFATIPAGAEPTGITFSPDYKFLFLSVQHPDNTNTASQLDASGNAVVFDTHTAIVISRKENLGSVVLPVRFINFAAVQTGTSVAISWSAMVSPEHAFFEIQRSDNGYQFETIGRDATKNSSFNFIDKTVTPATVVYYRIKQYDKNGNSSYSEIQPVRFTGDALLQLYPVPAASLLYVTYRSDNAGIVELKVVNTSGQVVKQSGIAIKKGLNQINLNTASLPTGNYFLQLQHNGMIENHSFLKL